MNILFVLYGDLTSNSANPLALYSREFAARGHSCVVAVPGNLDSINEHRNAAFQAVLYSDALAHPESIFPNGSAADILHAWTPRENVRRFVGAYMARCPTPLLVYLEDNESCLSALALGLTDELLLQQTEKDIADRLPDALANPFRYSSFIGLADAAVVIQSKLTVEVPPWVSCETVLPGVDLEFFYPKTAKEALRLRYGIADAERVIVYHGGINGFTRLGVANLCRAVGFINQQGFPCKLLRTGPFAIDFWDELPVDSRATIVELGVVDRADLPDLLALADVLVQPGKIDPFEDLRLPGKLPEMLAMGRPVVTPNVNIAHLFTDGIDVVLTYTGAPSEIAVKCIALFSDEQRANRIGQAGRQFAEKHFDIKKQAICLEQMYQMACRNFDATIAAKVWQAPAENASADSMLARKINLLANSRYALPSLSIQSVLREHARVIESKQSRVHGLEVAIAEKDRQIADMQNDANALRTSASWRITAPLRWLRSLGKK